MVGCRLLVTLPVIPVMGFDIGLPHMMVFIISLYGDKMRGERKILFTVRGANAKCCATVCSQP
jgi:hypothetical protein